jgi:hypothetical protein
LGGYEGGSRGLMLPGEMEKSAATWDGEITHFGATGVQISELSTDGWKALVFTRRVTADVLIADSRLTVSLRHGEAPFTRQVDYGSLTGVGFRPRVGWRSRETLRLGVLVEGRRQLCIDLTLRAQVDSAEVAQVIARRAARHLLRHAPAGRRKHYSELAVAARLPLPRRDEFAVYQFVPAPREAASAEDLDAHVREATRPVATAGAAG